MFSPLHPEHLIIFPPFKLTVISDDSYHVFSSLPSIKGAYNAPTFPSISLIIICVSSILWTCLKQVCHHYSTSSKQHFLYTVQWSFLRKFALRIPFPLQVCSALRNTSMKVLIRTNFHDKVSSIQKQEKAVNPRLWIMHFCRNNYVYMNSVLNPYLYFKFCWLLFTQFESLYKGSFIFWQVPEGTYYS